MDAKSIIQLGRRLLREAGLTIQSPRSTQRIREAFKLGRVHKEAHIALHALLPRIPLGKAWLPLNKVTLSAAAGHAIRDRMFHPKCMNGLADPLEHIYMALDEVVGVLFHRLASVPNLRSSVQDGNLDALIHVAQTFSRSKPKESNVVETIETTNLYTEPGQLQFNPTDSDVIDISHIQSSLVRYFIRQTTCNISQLTILL